MELLLLLGSFVLFSPSVLADGLYSKSSAVLQIDASNYDRLIAKSNYTSMLEFYAPWCGHCKNLKPAYEKAASSLAGYAKVAAINCDDEMNKPFCGNMGVQGFPTLKLIKPKKKGGRPSIEDYQGPRTAKAIKEVLSDKIPNHVTKLTDKTYEAWLSSGNKPKALFFTEKTTISPMVKSIAIDFKGSMDVAQIRSTEGAAVGRFMVEKFPVAFFMGSPEHMPDQYRGEMNKASLIEFFTETGSIAPNPEFPSTQAKASKKKPQSKTASKEPSSAKKPEAASETLQKSSCPMASPDPNVAAENPAPVQLPIEPAAEILSLDSHTTLQEACLNTNSGTCVLAVLSGENGKENSGLRSLAEIAQKHVQRRAKLFPIYSVPASNVAGQGLISSLGIKSDASGVTLVGLNAKRGWWSRYAAAPTDPEAIEDWIDSIRLGDFKKETLPDGIIEEVVGNPEEKPGRGEPSEDENVVAHQEL